LLSLFYFLLFTLLYIKKNQFKKSLLKHSIKQNFQIAQLPSNHFTRMVNNLNIRYFGDMLLSTLTVAVKNYTELLLHPHQAALEFGKGRYRCRHLAILYLKRKTTKSLLKRRQTFKRCWLHRISFSRAFISIFLSRALSILGVSPYSAKRRSTAAVSLSCPT
jgi:hypothetical protein